MCVFVVVFWGLNSMAFFSDFRWARVCELVGNMVGVFEFFILEVNC